MYRVMVNKQKKTRRKKVGAKETGDKALPRANKSISVRL